MGRTCSEIQLLAQTKEVRETSLQVALVVTEYWQRVCITPTGNAELVARGQEAMTGFYAAAREELGFDRYGLPSNPTISDQPDTKNG
jgi:hypothetical protein